VKAEYLEMALALGKCVFPVGSNQKRFARNMASLARSKPEADITDRQIVYLEMLYHAYRRQIPNHKALCAVCQKKANRP